MCNEKTTQIDIFILRNLELLAVDDSLVYVECWHKPGPANVKKIRQDCKCFTRHNFIKQKPLIYEECMYVAFVYKDDIFLTTYTILCIEMWQCHSFYQSKPIFLIEMLATEKEKNIS